MKGFLSPNIYSSITLGGMGLFVTCSFFTDEPYLLMLTVAQLVFIPVMLQMILDIKKLHVFFIWLGMLSIVLLHVYTSDIGQLVFSSLYFIFTVFVALCGLYRFLNRGFVNWAEISIDIGMMYLFIGGGWLFIYQNGIDMGFSSLINWLTAIHFHYSAFLLPISIGLLGRMQMSRLYRWIVSFVIAGPLLVAIGITFWPFLEFFSVLLYIFAIYSLVYLAFKTRFPSLLQALFVRLSYCALSITILFSFLYAAGRAFGIWYVGIDFMLTFHGIFNCLLFGLLGLIGWAIKVPKSKQQGWSFPVSQIRGKLKVDDTYEQGLVEHLNVFVDTKVLPSTIIDFYEHTERYRLFSSVRWAAWFKPFLLIYKLFSVQIQQLNLPISSKTTEMKGEIFAVDPLMDGRKNPRAWVRKIRKDTVFTAIYSYHENMGRTYMNIALPLPFSTMIGILQLNEINGSLVLSSEGEGDLGIYLAIGKMLFKLPLSEYFLIEEIREGELTATHKMRLFGIPFLLIHYSIIQSEAAS